MKSLYQNRKFAEYWNERAGNSGEIYKRLILDPIMFKLVGSFKNKVILELGCGNGYLASKFISQDPQKLILMDISKYNLKYAKEKCSDRRIIFFEQDATKRWKIKTGLIDIVYSNMMLDEIKNINTPIEEAYRVLKKNGYFIFSVTHPSWDLFTYAQEKAGVKAKKIRGLGGYFRRGYSKFIMNGDSKTNPSLKDKYKEEFGIEHYQRPLSDYYNSLVKTGFSIKRIIEPELTKRLIKENPKFIEYKDHPVGLVFYCIKQNQIIIHQH